MKKFIVTLIILALVWLWFEQSQQAQVKSVKNTDNNTMKSKEGYKVKNRQQSKVELIPESFNLPDGQLFHKDLVVDTLIGINHFAPCHLYFSDKPDDKTQLQQTSPQQMKYLTPFFKACDSEQEQFKHYNKDRIMTKLASAGNKLKATQDAYLNDPEGVVRQMKQADGYELLLASTIYKGYFSTVILPEVKSMLNAKNNDMLRLVIDEAMLMIACEKGVDCTYVSGLMMSRCIKDESACGLSFYEYLNKQYLPGIRQEINLTEAYLNNHFGF